MKVVASNISAILDSICSYLLYSALVVDLTSDFADSGCERMAKACSISIYQSHLAELVARPIILLNSAHQVTILVKRLDQHFHLLLNCCDLEGLRRFYSLSN